MVERWKIPQMVLRKYAHYFDEKSYAKNYPLIEFELSNGEQISVGVGLEDMEILFVLYRGVSHSIDGLHIEFIEKDKIYIITTPDGHMLSKFIECERNYLIEEFDDTRIEKLK